MDTNWMSIDNYTRHHHCQCESCYTAGEVNELPNAASGRTEAVSVNWSPALITRLFFPSHSINLLNITVTFNLLAC